MKKNLFLALGALCLAGCLSSTTLIKLDQEFPPEKSCTLNIASTVTIKQFNGQDVNWRADLGDAWASVRLPEGSHTFVIDYSRMVSGGQHYQSSIKTGPHHLLAGHTYRMWGAEGAAEAKGYQGVKGLGNMLSDTFKDPLNTMQENWADRDRLTIMVDDITGQCDELPNPCSSNPQ